jgi:hypothetical protein
LFVVPFALLSIAATVQVSLEAQATMAGHTDTAKAKLEDLRAENAELKAERLRMGTVQTPDVIKRQMEAMEFDRRWTTSAGCTKATASASRSFCAEHRALFSKLAAANHATELRQRIDTLLDRIRNATTTETVTQHQAGLQAMADGAGIDKQVVAVIVMLAMGVAIVVGGIVAWAIASGRGDRQEGSARQSRATSAATADGSQKRQQKSSAKRSPKVVKPSVPASSTPSVQSALPSNVTPIKPRQIEATDGFHRGATTDDPVAAFFDECLTSVPDARLPAHHVQSAFTVWCTRRQIAPVSSTKFGMDMTRLGIRKTRGGQNGSRVYHDVALRT